ncbi:MAG: hypothetical protein LBR38_08715 [Synergistaceae bacterium]|jgi:2-keto-4-pentenoate hydratase|nr:hypothetical protein [Synergistaceae bacterium]
MSSKKLTALLALFILSLGVAFAAHTAELDEVASIYFDAAQNGKPMPILEAQPTLRTPENAYAIQRLLVDKLLAAKGDEIAGFKAGATAPAQMERFGSKEPASAPLFKSGLIELSDPSQPIKIAPFGGIMLETELAFKAARPITEPVKDEAELKSLVESVHPAIEVPSVYFEDMSKVRFFDLTAAGIGSKMFIIGPAVSVADIDPDSVAVTLKRGGETVNEGKGTDALGGQWKALLWLVNNTVKQGYDVKAGQYFMTGALGSMIPAKAGAYEADFSPAPLSKILFEVTE